MKFGILNVFSPGYTAKRRTAGEVINWDLQVTEWADRYGLDEAYFAEHYTIGAEASPAPDLMIAAASQRTKRITLGAAAHLLPYHNPVALAHRMMWLDHMTGGRYIAGVAPGAFPTDAGLFGTGKNNAKMMTEALDIIEAIWSREGPFRIDGEFFTVDMPGYSDKIRGPHLKPREKAKIPIMMTGMQASSPTLTEAGRRGCLPLSQHVDEAVLRRHWQTYSQAALAAGHVPVRSDWRICRDIFVADTDSEARSLALDGAMGSLWRSWNLPNFRTLGILDLLAGENVAPDDVSIEWLVDNMFLVGSPETVAAKISRLYHSIGGCGTIVTFVHDYYGEAECYRRSFELLGTVVRPMLAELTPEN
jgi:alkanesulfonate monooxygenase SsuD/methylene tetrahydromethanopterin reductase-like flavin-dependent oxidoreductase (luciferase family)